MKKTAILFTAIAIIASLLQTNNCEAKRRWLDNITNFEIEVEPKNAYVIAIYVPWREKEKKEHKRVKIDKNIFKVKTKVYLPPFKKKWDKTLHIKFKIFKDGYVTQTITPDKITRKNWKSKRVDNTNELFYKHSKKIVLEKIPNFKGSTTDPALIQTTINSEPSGASIYENGKKIGTTPTTFMVKVTPASYKLSTLTTGKITIIKEGYFLQEKQLFMKVSPEWIYRSGEIVNEVHNLTILQQNPAFIPTPKTTISNTYNSVAAPQNQPQNITVTHKTGNKIVDAADTGVALRTLWDLSHMHK